jgi:phage shock protein E
MMDLLQYLVPAGLFGWLFWTRFANKVRPEVAKQLVAEGAALIDVRTPGEFARGALPGARNIPLSEIGARAAEIGPKDKPVVLYCASGARSGSARRMLTGLGFTRVEDLGAMMRW